MKLAQEEILIAAGAFSQSEAWTGIRSDIRHAIRAVVWPPGSSKFTINPDRGRGRGQGNGVVPIKEACMDMLQKLGWNTDERRNPFRFDAVRHLEVTGKFGLEWETGNVSSSHRAINRILLAYKQGAILGGALVVPTRSLYGFLTDRVGSFSELEPYFEIWREVPWDNGVLVIFAVEHDDTSSRVPRIQKGTNGRARL